MTAGIGSECQAVVICMKCNERLQPVGNNTYRHAPTHYRSRGHRHRPLAAITPPLRVEPDQMPLPFAQPERITA